MFSSPAVWPLVIYFFLILALMAGLLAFTHVVGERHRAPQADEPFEAGIVGVGSARLRLSARYYLVAMFFVIFDVEALFVFAWAVAFHEAGWTGYLEMLVFIGILFAALVYVWRLGGLDWGPHRQIAPMPPPRRLR